MSLFTPKQPARKRGCNPLGVLVRLTFALPSVYVADIAIQASREGWSAALTGAVVVGGVLGVAAFFVFDSTGLRRSIIRDALKPGNVVTDEGITLSAEAMASIQGRVKRRVIAAVGVALGIAGMNVAAYTFLDVSPYVFVWALVRTGLMPESVADFL